MAKIIDARVRQKVGTEAEWLANDLTLLDGEAAIVRTGDGTPVNLKFGDGNKKFSELPYFIDFNNAQRISSVSPGALPTPTEENVYMVVTGVGVYTYGGATIGTNADGYQTTFWWNGSTWVNNGSAKIKGDEGDSIALEWSGDSVDAGLVYPSNRTYQGVLYRVREGQTTIATDNPSKSPKYEVIDSFNKLFDRASITHNVFTQLFKDIVIYLTKDSELPLSVWLDTGQTTSTRLYVVFYNYPADVRTIVGVLDANLTLGSDVQRYFIRNGADTREVGYVDIDKKYIADIIVLNIADRAKHVLSEKAYLQNRVEILNSNSSILKTGFKYRFHQINLAIKDLLIISKQNISEVTVNRLHFNGTNYVFNVRFKNEVGTYSNLDYSSTVVPLDPRNHQIAVSSPDDKYNLSVTIDWTLVKLATLSNATVVAEGESSGNAPYSWLGVSDKYIIQSNKVSLYNKVLETGGSGASPVAGMPLSEYIVLSEDSPSWMQTWLSGIYPEEAILISSNEVTINSFMDSLLSDFKVTVRMIGNFTARSGIKKHPNVNLLGYGATIKMDDGANAEYERAINITTGGKTFAQAPFVSHKGTWIKGFVLDGNMDNNTSYRALYACGMTPEVFNSDLTTYSDVQYVTDVHVEDIQTKNFKRSGIVAGEGWTGKNITFENSSNDHGFYAVGGGNIFFENLYFKGNFNRGALSVAGNNKLYQRYKSDNIILRNLVFDECLGGPHIEVRGKFDNTNYPCNNVLIDGLRMVNTSSLGVIPFSFGNLNSTDPTPTTYDGFAKGIEIRNMYVDINSYNILFNILRAQVTLSGTILIQKGRIDRPMFRIAGCGDSILNQLDLSGLNIIFKNSLENYPIFGFYNDVTPVNVINGMKLDGMSIKSPTNDFYLFDLNNASSNDFTVKNLSMVNVIGNHKATVNPTVSSKITFSTEGVIPSP